MIKYQSKQDVPDIFLCSICKEICDIPLSCFRCNQCICYCCLQNFNTCPKFSCFCQNGAYHITTVIKGSFIRQTQIKCSYCFKFLKYHNYQKHITLCEKIHKYEILYQTYFNQIRSNLEEDQQQNFVCQICQNQNYYLQQCTQCQQSYCEICINNINSGYRNDGCADHIQKLVQINQSVQLACKSCNILVAKENILNHFLKCVQNNTTDYRQDQYNLICRTFIYPFYRLNYKQSIKEKLKKEKYIYQEMKLAREILNVKLSYKLKMKIKSIHLQRLQLLQCESINQI